MAVLRIFGLWDAFFLSFLLGTICSIRNRMKAPECRGIRTTMTVSDGDSFRFRDDDHIALIAEILGPATQNLIRSPLGQHYYLPDGRLRRMPDLVSWHLHEILSESYGYGSSDAIEIASFLSPMLHLDPTRRVTARQHLKHPWLRSVM